MHALRTWLVVVRLGLVQAAIGAIVVFTTSTLNRIMVVELALPAIVPGALVSLHYVVQMSRPRWGYGSDAGGRRTPWITGGMVVLAVGSLLATLATLLLPSIPAAGLALAVVAYGLVGLGVGAAGTSLLVLLAALVPERSKAAAASLAWIMMIAGFIVTAAIVHALLQPFSGPHLLRAGAVIAVSSVLLAILAIRGVETAATLPVRPAVRARAPEPAGSFGAALSAVWAEPEARRFTLFVFVSMLAYSAQELIVEPFAGAVLGLAPAESARLVGIQHGGLLAGMVLVALLASGIGGPRFGSMRLWTAAGCGASALAILAVAVLGATGAARGVAPALFTLGVANGSFSIASIAAMMQMAGGGAGRGARREGTRMGLWGAAQALAFGLGGVVGTGASDIARAVFGSPVSAYAAVFAGEAVLFCAAAHLAFRSFRQADHGLAAHPLAAE